MNKEVKKTIAIEIVINDRNQMIKSDRNFLQFCYTMDKGKCLPLAMRRGKRNIAGNFATCRWCGV